MRATYDEETDGAYIYLRAIGPGEAVQQVLVEDDRLRGDVILDLDRDGKLLGIEVLGARSLLPTNVLRPSLWRRFANPNAKPS
ncbi:MAG: DUF2283 domain-containing protein [Actinomycetota bacterium]|nr:DUF2283 domain-containing protein [Actinomycetota bacterium]